MSLDIVLRLITTGKPDDIIKIRPRRSTPGSFTVSYSSGGNSRIRWITTYDRDGVCDYVRNTMNILAKDADPIHTLQAMVPGYPDIFIRHADIQTLSGYNMVINTITSVIYNYPSAFTV
jgi:hypothetical protein